MANAKTALTAKFNANVENLTDPEKAETAAAVLKSALCDKDWKTLGLAQADQDKVFSMLDSAQYADVADAINSAKTEATKRKNAMKKTATKKTTEATAKKKATKKAKTGVAATAVKAPAKKAKVAKSRYGHRVGSSADFMDNQLWKGVDPDKGAEALSAKFGMDVAKAKAKLLVHVRYLKKERDVSFTKFKDSPKLKAKTEKIVWPKAK